MGRILVIGAKGMLGRDLMEVLRLDFRSDEIIGWDIDEIDISEESSIEKIVMIRPQILINLAAYTDVDGCEKGRERAFLVNTEGVKNVTIAARRAGSKVIYISTDYIFDGKKNEPYLEDDMPNPINVYGQSKLEGERYIRELLERGLIIRTQWLYGRHGNNFVSSILRQAKEKKILYIVSDQIGSPTYTLDLSWAISLLIKRNSWGVFHVANSGSCSWYTFGERILEFSGLRDVKVVPISTEQSGRIASRPSYSVLNTEKFQRETGKVMRHWSQALREYLFSITESKREGA